ncbi:hypothetical protein SAMN05216564_103374 [Halopenitus persicus]|uniref:Uncharacterized protein n=1 Tax=Halopenitus persicus TaxID=1048396 RepID=A0A1H3HPI6_9EURY|nr:hypothetical protein SAMN05216564_103374 [Halopenitus persicus]
MRATEGNPTNLSSFHSALSTGDSPIGDVDDMMDSHLRDGVSLSVSHITSTGNWNATERIATDFSSEH